MASSAQLKLNKIIKSPNFQKQSKNKFLSYSKKIDKNSDQLIKHNCDSAKKIDSKSLTLLRESVEYFAELSVLVLPLQKYTSSIVGWSWVLAARKVRFE